VTICLIHILKQSATVNHYFCTYISTNQLQYSSNCKK